MCAQSKGMDGEARIEPKKSQKMVGWRLGD